MYLRNIRTGLVRKYGEKNDSLIIEPGGERLYYYDLEGGGTSKPDGDYRFQMPKDGKSHTELAGLEYCVFNRGGFDLSDEFDQLEASLLKEEDEFGRFSIEYCRGYVNALKKARELVHDLRNRRDL